MAGDYIFIEADLCQQRKVLAIGRRCGWNAFETVGRLVHFWSWLTAQPVEELEGGNVGVLVDVTVDALVDAGVAPREMLEAMKTAHWLKVGEHNGAPAILIPDWNSWLSRSAKARRNKGIRQREWRARHSNVDASVDGPVDASVDARVDGADNRGEERGKKKEKKEGRGKKSEGKGSAASAAIHPFDAWWKLVHRKVGKEECRKQFDRTVKGLCKTYCWTPEEAHTFLCERMTAFAASPKGKAGRHSPYPVRWLRNGRYDDDPKEWEVESDGDSSTTISGRIH